MATKYKYDKDTDYQALINRSVESGDYTAAAIYEQQRNAKIAGEGLDVAPTGKYEQYLPYQEVREYDDSARAQAETLLNQTDDPYAQEIDSLLDSLLGADFDYDPASDALYGAYRKQYLREAELAAQDALGDAAALTGGRASTAAVAASQQAGNAYRAKAADKLPELAQLAYDRYLGSRDDRRDTLDALLSARGGDRDEAWKRISALLDLDKDAYERYASGIRTDQARKAASAEAEQKAQEEAEKAASQAASDAQADARTQISLILKNGGTVPAALWNKSGYDAATIAALKAGAAAQK